MCTAPPGKKDTVNWLVTGGPVTGVPPGPPVPLPVPLAVAVAVAVAVCVLVPELGVPPAATCTVGPEMVNVVCAVCGVPLAEELVLIVCAAEEEAAARATGPRVGELGMRCSITQASAGMERSGKGSRNGCERVYVRVLDKLRELEKDRGVAKLRRRGTKRQRE